MKTAKVNAGDVLISLPVEYMEQQTSISSVFEDVPAEMVDRDALIEANKHGVAWDYMNEHKVLHISVPNELIKWEE